MNNPIKDMYQDYLGGDAKMTPELKQVMEGIKNGTTLILDSPNDSFTFACDMCGDCCKTCGPIFLSPFEIFMISKELQVAPSEWMPGKAGSYMGDGSNLIVTRLDFEDTQIDGVNACPFLEKKKMKDISSTYNENVLLNPEQDVYVCKVHNAKPDTCAIYPLGRYSGFDMNTEESETFYIVQYEACQKRLANAVKTTTPAAYLKGSNRADDSFYTQAKSDWLKFATRIHELSNILDIHVSKLEQRLYEKDAADMPDIIKALAKTVGMDEVPVQMSDESAVAMKRCHIIRDEVLITMLTKLYQEFYEKADWVTLTEQEALERINICYNEIYNHLVQFADPTSKLSIALEEWAGVFNSMLPFSYLRPEWIEIFSEVEGHMIYIDDFFERKDKTYASYLLMMRVMLKFPVSPEQLELRDQELFDLLQISLEKMHVIADQRKSELMGEIDKVVDNFVDTIETARDEVAADGLANLPPQLTPLQ